MISNKIKSINICKKSVSTKGQKLFQKKDTSNNTNITRRQSLEKRHFFVGKQFKKIVRIKNKEASQSELENKKSSHW